MARAFKFEQEKSLLFRLSLLCMAAVAGKEDDLRQSTEMILDYVSELIEPYSTTGKPGVRSR